MALSTKIIRRRIRSIKNTKKITKAMEMVAAAKMRKSVNSVLLSRAYSHTAWQVILNLTQRVDEDKHPLLKRRKLIKKICSILISSNRGLCAGFNSHIFSKAVRHFDRTLKSSEVKMDWITMGKKGSEYLAKNKMNIIATFPKQEVVSGIQDITAVSRMIIDGYINKDFDEVYLIYTDFISAILQKPRIKKLLPFESEEDMELGRVSQKENTEFSIAEEYEFEPSADAVIDLFLRRLIDVQLYQALLESTASEHSARMMAMRQATDAAGDMIDELTLIFNQARQGAITKEIAEIAGGKAVLENS